MEDRQPMFEFIHYPKFGEAERACPAVKIVYTLYSDEQTLYDMRMKPPRGLFKKKLE